MSDIGILFAIFRAVSYLGIGAHVHTAFLVFPTSSAAFSQQKQLQVEGRAISHVIKVASCSLLLLLPSVRKVLCK